MKFGERLNLRMRELGYNQMALARATGLSQNYLSNVISGERGKRLSYRTVVALKKALEVDDDFFSDDVSLSGSERTQVSSVG